MPCSPPPPPPSPAAMTKAVVKLHTGPPLPATLLRRASGIVDAALILTMLYLFGLPGAILTQLRLAVLQLKPWLLLSPRAWRDAIVANGLPVLLKLSDKRGGELKHQAVYPYAKGRTLEIGAGTGMTIKYYNPDKITDLFLVEPFAELHAELRATVAAASGLRDKTHIVPFGVENRAKLRAAGVTPGSFDTISLVQVLCSIPEPEKNLKYLQTLLKPGGQVLLFEHVASDDRLTQTLQSLYNPIWTTLSGGCNVNRHSVRTVEALGGWKDVVVQRPDAEHAALLYPHMAARFVKS